MMQAKEIKNILSSRYDFTKWRSVLDFIFPKIQYESNSIVIPDTSEMVQHIHQKGQIDLTDHKKIIILEIQVKSKHNIARTKVGFNNIASKYIDQANNHGLLVFYTSEDPEQTNYRLSFISKESRFNEDGEFSEFTTNPKRYTYLLGPQEACTTAASRFIELASKRNTFDFVLQDVIDAFSVEKLNNQFFKRYKDQFDIFTQHLSNPQNGYRYDVFKISESEVEADKEKNELPIRNFTKKLLARIVFIYFLQRKGWMGVTTPKGTEKIKWSNGIKDFVAALFTEVDDKDKFHSKYLSELFYNTLNNENRNNFTFLVDDMSPFKSRGTVSVPYLNGGLFDNDLPEANSIDFPSPLFHDLFEFLNQYNFTIDENSPEDHEVGIDPEMLGHIFENLLEDNRDKGAYYTPKEVVHYMSQQSLIAYLNSKLQSETNEIRDFIKAKSISPFIEANTDKLISFLSTVKVCDPAIGSGAFPMGVLKEIFTALSSLYKLKSPYTPLNEAQIKREIIQNSIYGVDLEKGAVDIARLRFWLALVVDEEAPEPLPNLDYKIVTGNSLLHRFPLDNPIDEVFKDFNKTIQSDDYNNHVVKNHIGNNKVDLDYYKILVSNYLNVSSIEKKETFKTIIKEVKSAFKTSFSKSEITKVANARAKVDKLTFVDVFGKQVGTKTQIKNAKKKFNELIKDRKKVESGIIYKDAIEWRFEFPNLLDENGDFSGFDIVIGNPPYIKEYTNKSVFNGLRDSPYYMGKMDIWYFFACFCIDLLKDDGGIQCFIAQNNWVTSAGAARLRDKILTDTEMLSFIDFGNYKVFQSAGIQTMIYVLKKTSQPKDTYTTTYSKLLVENIDKTFLDHFLQAEETTDQDKFEKLDFLFVPSNYENGYITFANDSTGKILKAIQNNEVVFLDKNEVAQGIVFPQDFLNKKNALKLNNEFKIGSGIFALNKSEVQELNLSESEKHLLKPYFSTDSFNRYFGLNETNNVLIYTNSSFKRPEKIEPYPSIKRHLDKFSSIITSDNKPYGLHRARDERFFVGEKIIAQRKCPGRPIFTYTDFDTYVSATFYLIKTDSLNHKYLTALLNSKLIAFWLRHKGKMQGSNYQIDKAPLVNIPIKTPQNTISFEILCDYLILLNDPTSASVNNYTINGDVAYVFEEVLDMMIYELYFEEHMTENDLDVMQFIDTAKYIKPINDLPSKEKSKIVADCYTWLQKEDNPIRNRIMLANVRSKDFIGKINSATH